MMTDEDLSIIENSPVDTLKLKELGWIFIEFKFEITGQMIEWMSENFSDDSEAYWLNNMYIGFRKPEDAVQFKLRWL